MDGNIDILVITESKLGDPFSAVEFVMDGYRLPYRKGRDQNGG